jgi:hypothetical protein
MDERESYLAYIIALRTGDRESVNQLLESGFRPDRHRLMELTYIDPLFKKILFNREITIYLDVGHIVGHVYGEFPIHSSEHNRIKKKIVGFYPRTNSFYQIFIGAGSLKDEVTETGRAFEKLEKIQATLPLTEEAWVRLSYWMELKQKEIRSYSIYKKNCAGFVHDALKAAGYSDGLVDKFNAGELRRLSFRPIHIEMPRYLRISSLSKVLPGLSFVVRPEGLKIGARWKLDWYAVAEEQREIANKKSHTNQMNCFFDTHHDSDFYRIFFRGKSLTYDDVKWLIRNNAPGMRGKIKAIVSQAYRDAPKDIQQRYGDSEENFSWRVIGSFLRGSVVPTDVQRLIRAVRIDSKRDEINEMFESYSVKKSQFIEDSFPGGINYIGGDYPFIETIPWIINSSDVIWEEEDGKKEGANKTISTPLLPRKETTNEYRRFKEAMDSRLLHHYDTPPETLSSSGMATLSPIPSLEHPLSPMILPGFAPPPSLRTCSLFEKPAFPAFTKFKERAGSAIPELGYAPPSFLTGFQRERAEFNRKTAIMDTTSAHAVRGATGPSTGKKLLNIVIHYRNNDTVDQLSSRLTGAARGPGRSFS